MSTTPKSRPYVRFLTSALHSRFVNAILLAVVNGLVIAFFTGADLFWSWWPIGPAGVKAVFFSISCACVFILQLGTLTVGRRTQVSPLVFIQSFLSGSTGQLMLWYNVSAFWFCEVYIWSVPEDKRLQWVIRGDDSTPDKLNERPIYLRFFFMFLALVQSCIHVYCNHSALHIPVTKPSTSDTNDSRTHSMDSNLIDIRRILHIGRHALTSSGLATLVSPFIYRLVRNPFWQFHLFWAKLFFNISKADEMPPDTYFIGSILAGAFFIGIILSLTWELSAYNLLRCLQREPLKNGLPLSAASQDPNGTLLSGLVAKRNVVKTFAFWELAIIAQKFPDRRKAIFTDIERKDGPMWTSMHKAALSVISSIDGRLPSVEVKAATDPPKPEILALPRLTKDVRRDKIAAPMPPSATRVEQVENILTITGVKALGQSKDPWRPPIDKTAQELIDLAKSEIEHNKGYVTQFADYLPLRLLNNLFGPRPAASITGSVLGAPVGNASVIVDAIESVSKMLIASLNEDAYGKVVHTVPETVKQFTKTIQTIEKRIADEFHLLGADDERELFEVLTIVERLKIGLRELLGAFQIFLSDVGLSIKDLNEAKKASEDRQLLPKQETKTASQHNTVEMEEVQSVTRQNQHQQPELTREERLRRQEHGARRIEPLRQQQRRSNGNVFGAKDLSFQEPRRR